MRRTRSVCMGWRARPQALLLSCLAVVVFAACRKGKDQVAADFIPLAPPTAGNQGCATPAQNFSAGPNLLNIDLGAFSLGSSSRMTASRSAPLLFLTGANADVLELDVSAVDAPVGRTLVQPGVIDALISSVGITLPAELSGLAVLDDGSLVVVEHTSNTLLLVSRLVADTVTFLAGLPDANGGFVDGLGGQVRFNFDAPTSVVPSGSGLLFVADSGNHAIREVFLGVLPQVVTIAGTGSPGFQDGSLASSQFDTPTGLSIACDGRLFVSEAGNLGLGGNRIRAMSLGSPGLFGGFSGFVETVAGSGVPASTEGVGAAADLAQPSALFSTQDGSVYFVDGLSGHMRRLDLAAGLVDCPLDSSGCTLPNGLLAGSLNVGITVSSAGDLFFLLGSLGSLMRFVAM